jgi:hypothetical protein
MCILHCVIKIQCNYVILAADFIDMLFSYSLYCEVGITFFNGKTRKFGKYARTNTEYKKKSMVDLAFLDLAMQESVPHATVMCHPDFQ